MCSGAGSTYGVRMLRRTAAAVVMALALGVLVSAPAAQAATATVTGRIVDEYGTPVNSLDIWGGTSMAKTSVTGTFSIAVEAGPFALDVWDNDYQQFGHSHVIRGTATAGTTDLGTVVLRSTPNPGRATRAIDTTRKAAVRKAYRGTLRPTLRGERYLAPRGCKVAPTPKKAQRRTITAVNYMRAMSGLDPVALDSKLSRKAQKSALIQHYQGYLSHYPSKSARCATKAGVRASARSNIALGWEGARVILGYMAEPGAHNTAAGHRRWIQDPFTETMGTGQAGRAHALYVLSKFSEANPTPRYLSWPTAGYFPAELEPARRWSFGVSRSRDVSFANVKVTAASKGKKLKLRTYAVQPGYGDQLSVVWDFAKPVTVRRGTRSVAVTISGMTQRGVRLPAHTYIVRLFRAG